MKIAILPLWVMIPSLHLMISRLPPLRASFALLSFIWTITSLTAAPAAGVFDVRAFGATGDGRTLDTAAIQRTVDAASAAGGGTVSFSAGTYLSTTVTLRSHITLSLGAGATLRAASHEVHPYPPAASDPAAPKTESESKAYLQPSLIFGRDLEDIGIVGPGRIVGEGLLRDLNLSPTAANKAITLWNCRSVILRDFTIFRGGHFALMAITVDNLTLDNLTVDTERDGLDFESCRNVRISNCSVNTPFDDGICLKSGKAAGAQRLTENVTITNCTVSGFDLGTLLDGTRQRNTDFSRAAPAGATGLAAFGAQERTRKNNGGPTGRIKFGTGSLGGFRNITITNCVFEHCRGLALEAVDGGVLEDVSISNITMRDIANSPIFIRLGRRGVGPNGEVSAIRRVTLSNITVSEADPRQGCIITGLPGHCIEDIRLSNIRITYRGGGTEKDADREPEEFEADYPEPFLFGTMPAYGFYVRHVRGLSLDQIDLATTTPDQRPAFVLKDVSDAAFTAIRSSRDPATPVFVLQQTQGLRWRDVQGVPDQQQSASVDQARLPREAPLANAAPRLRVFVIGDSISQQYGPYLEPLLAPRFAYDRKQDAGTDVSTNLDIPKGANGGDSAMVLAYLRVRRERDPIQADVLLLNCGLHDIKRNPQTRAIQVELPAYIANLRAILTEAAAQHLQVVWMRTTPVVDEIHNAKSTAFHRFASDLTAYNQAADEVMCAAGVPVVDLHGFTASFVPAGIIDHVHYIESVREKQAAFLAGALFALADEGRLVAKQP
jgi:polygalacturonase/lysophospholipase L1-like esterase